MQNVGSSERLQLQWGIFCFVPSCLKWLPWNCLFLQNLHKHELFLPTLHQPTKIMLLGITHIHCLLAATELQHTTKLPWGSRGMSHKLTCSPFEFFFLSPVLMYTAYEILREKINYAWPKNMARVSVCFRRGHGPCRECRFTISPQVLPTPPPSKVLHK